MPIDKVLSSRRQEILRVAERCGAREVRVFGPRARDEARRDSDFDILVTVGEHTSLLEVVAIKQDMEDLLGSTVHIVTEDAIRPYLREQVLREAVRLGRCKNEPPATSPDGYNVNARCALNFSWRCGI